MSRVNLLAFVGRASQGIPGIALRKLSLEDAGVKRRPPPSESIRDRTLEMAALLGPGFALPHDIQN